jgi:hypothetical protein
MYRNIEAPASDFPHLQKDLLISFYFLTSSTIKIEQRNLILRSTIF